jgi:hypothetical protein
MVWLDGRVMRTTRYSARGGKPEISPALQPAPSLRRRPSAAPSAKTQRAEQDHPAFRLIRAHSSLFKPIQAYSSLFKVKKISSPLPMNPPPSCPPPSSATAAPSPPPAIPSAPRLTFLRTATVLDQPILKVLQGGFNSVQGRSSLLNAKKHSRNRWRRRTFIQPCNLLSSPSTLLRLEFTGLNVVKIGDVIRAQPFQKSAAIRTGSNPVPS